MSRGKRSRACYFGNSRGNNTPVLNLFGRLTAGDRGATSGVKRDPVFQKFQMRERQAVYSTLQMHFPVHFPWWLVGFGNENEKQSD